MSSVKTVNSGGGCNGCCAECSRPRRGKLEKVAVLPDVDTCKIIVTGSRCDPLKK